MDEQGEVFRRFEPSDERHLSGAILEAVEAYTGEDISKSEFQLYDSIDPDALDSLFRFGAGAHTTVQFDLGDVRVKLEGNGGVDIRVTEQAP